MEIHLNLEFEAKLDTFTALSIQVIKQMNSNIPEEPLFKIQF